jgi:hypothetical protein
MKGLSGENRESVARLLTVANTFGNSSGRLERPIVEKKAACAPAEYGDGIEKQRARRRDAYAPAQP